MKPGAWIIAAVENNVKNTALLPANQLRPTVTGHLGGHVEGCERGMNSVSALDRPGNWEAPVG